MPFVYNILLTIAGIDSKKNKMKAIPSVASAYSLLLHQRNIELSAYQRLTSSICLEGHLTDEVYNLSIRLLSAHMLAGMSGGFPGVLPFCPTYRLACLDMSEVIMKKPVFHICKKKSRSVCSEPQKTGLLLIQLLSW